MQHLFCVSTMMQSINKKKNVKNVDKYMKNLIQKFCDY